MERIRLSKSEKEVIRLLNTGVANVPGNVVRKGYSHTAHSLQDKGLVRCTYLVNGEVWDMRLTQFGKEYLFENPRLYNPINWNLTLAIISVVISIITLLVVCMRKY
jgi:hypothetical protein